MIHRCHAEGCGSAVPPRMFACRAHWFALPSKVRAAIWREYRDGQEIDKRPSPAYMAVQRWAVAMLAFKPNDEAAAFRVAQLMAEALVWQRVAVDAGGADPLLGLTAKDPVGP